LLEQRPRVGVAGDRRVVGEPLDLLVGGSDAVLGVLYPFGELGSWLAAPVS
jgi:hypothetical protein